MPINDDLEGYDPHAAVLEMQRANGKLRDHVEQLREQVAALTSEKAELEQRVAELEEMLQHALDIPGRMAATPEALDWAHEKLAEIDNRGWCRCCKRRALVGYTLCQHCALTPGPDTGGE